MLFAVGCGDSNEEKDEPFKAATYEVGGVFAGDDIDGQVRREIVFLTETTFEMVQYDDGMVVTPEDLIERFDVPADKIDFTGEHTIKRIVYLSGTYTKDADKYSMKYNGQSAMSYKVGGESADKVRTLILDSLKLKGLSDETYEVYKAAFESRYEIPTEEDTTTAEMKVTL